MADKPFTHGPVALTTTLTTNIYNPPAGSGGVGPAATNQYAILTHIRVVNKTGSAATFSLWRGATGGNVAGTEFIANALSVAANSAYDWYGRARFDTADFLVGGAGTATALSIEIEGVLAVA